MEEIIERWKDIFSTSSRTLPKMVQFHDSISKHLHHHTCSRMLFDKIFETHCAQILSCFSPEAGTWLTTWLAFSTFWLFSPSFFTMLRTWFGLPHLSIVGIPQCVCTHPIDATGVPPIIFHPRQWAHMHPWCSSQHFCCLCLRCQLPCGMKTQDALRITTAYLLQGVNCCERDFDI